MSNLWERDWSDIDRLSAQTAAQLRIELNQLIRLQSIHLDALRFVSEALGNPFKGSKAHTCLDLGPELERQLNELREGIKVLSAPLSAEEKQKHFFATDAFGSRSTITSEVRFEIIIANRVKRAQLKGVPR
jgi:hypothetical protein